LHYTDEFKGGVMSKIKHLIIRFFLVDAVILFAATGGHLAAAEVTTSTSVKTPDSQVKTSMATQSSQQNSQQISAHQPGRHGGINEVYEFLDNGGMPTHQLPYKTEYTYNEDNVLPYSTSSTYYNVEKPSTYGYGHGYSGTGTHNVNGYSGYHHWNHGWHNNHWNNHHWNHHGGHLDQHGHHNRHHGHHGHQHHSHHGHHGGHHGGHHK
jgi:hypothetical protein